MAFLSDIEIAQSAKMQPITEIAKAAGIAEEYLEQYGKYKAKVDPAILKQSDRKNGKLYWLGNVIDDPSVIDGNDPRFPLQICEVDEVNACLIKDTMVVIDTIRDGQTSVELSNFELLEDPDTKDLQIHMTKINFNGKIQEDGYWYSEAWEYDVEFPEN